MIYFMLNISVVYFYSFIDLFNLYYIFRRGLYFCEVPWASDFDGVWHYRRLYYNNYYYYYYNYYTSSSSFCFCLASRCHLPLLFVGLEYGLTKNFKLAEKFFDQALAIAPSDPFVLHEMGVVEFHNGE